MTGIRYSKIALGLILYTSLYAQSFSVEKQSLEEAIKKIAIESYMPYIADGKLLQGKMAPKIDAIEGVKNALDKLLKGTDLEAVIENDTIIIREKNSNVALDTITIHAAEQSSVTEGTGSYTTPQTSTATKLTLSLRETPQTVHVVTRQTMDDFGLNDMKSVLALTPSVSTTTADSDRNNYISRGYAMQVQYDGIPSGSGIDGGVVTAPDGAIIDHTEVLIGAAGLLNGAGEPGGVVNIVRKRPTAESSASVEASAGSWDTHRVVADASGALNESKSVRARIVAVGEEYDSFRDYIGGKKQAFYSIVEADVSESTMLSAILYYQNIYDTTADRNGLPTANNGTDLHWGRSTFLSPDWNKWDKESLTTVVKLDQELPRDWKLKVSASRMKADADWLFGNYYNFDSNTGNAVFYRWAQETEEVSRDVDLFLSGPVAFLGREHEFIFGGNWSKRTWDNTNYDDSTYIATNLYTFDPTTSVPYPNLVLSGTGSIVTKQEGIYSAARLSLNDSLKLIIGSRASWYNYAYSDSDGYEERMKEDGELTPYAGLVYTINDWASAYISYADIFNPQSVKNSSGSLLDPEVGKSYEAGVKGEFLGGKLNTSFALFKIIKENEANLDESVPYDTNNICKGYCYNASGTTETKGFDIGFSGEILENWNVLGGYTQYQKEDFDATIKVFKIASTYFMPTLQTTVGASLDTATKTVGTWGQITDDRTLMGLFAKYQVNKNLYVKLNVENLFDETYYANAMGSGYGHLYYGDPRSVTLSMKYTF